MTIVKLMGSAALALLPIAGAAFAQTAATAEMPACENCSDSLVIMSWGGAYQAMQIAAYVQPYIDQTGVSVTWDESSGEAVAKLRAMSEPSSRMSVTSFSRSRTTWKRKLSRSV